MHAQEKANGQETASLLSDGAGWQNSSWLNNQQAPNSLTTPLTLFAARLEISPADTRASRADSRCASTGLSSIERFFSLTVHVSMGVKAAGTQGRAASHKQYYTRCTLRERQAHMEKELHAATCEALQ
jgi:hypothetical protein